MLFNSLDFQSSGKVDKILSDVVNEQLKAALANTRTDARKYVLEFSQILKDCLVEVEEEIYHSRKEHIYVRF